MSKQLTRKSLDQQTETQVVAMIARGDKHSAIVDELARSGINISAQTVGAIKKRNTHALKYMQDTMTQSALTHAESLLNKSRTLISKRLDRAMIAEQRRDELWARYQNDEIEWKEYFEAIGEWSDIALSELNSVSKEMFNQSQIEAGKPTGITESPERAKANLHKLLVAIKERDDVGALEAIFLTD